MVLLLDGNLEIILHIAYSCTHYLILTFFYVICISPNIWRYLYWAPLSEDGREQRPCAAGAVPDDRRPR